MGMPLSDQDLAILYEKYEDEDEGRIRYRDFIRAIDPESIYLVAMTHLQL